MTREELRRLLVTPEIVLVDLADAALVALHRAILVEHPTLSVSASSDDDHRRAALRVLKDSARLRRALRLYRSAAHRHHGDHDPHDLPF